MALIFYDAQGNKTTDPAKAVRVVVDNPGSVGDVSSTLIGDRSFARVGGSNDSNPDLVYRIGDKFYYIDKSVRDQILNSFGLSLSSIPKLSTDAVNGLNNGGDIKTADLNFFQGAKVSGSQDLSSGAGATGATQGDIANTPEAVLALQGYSPEQIQTIIQQRDAARLPSGMSVADAERLSAEQQAALKSALPKEGELFLNPIGEGASRLSVIKNGQVVGLGFNYPSDWQGKTIGQWQNEFNQQYAQQLGVDLNTLKTPNAADLNQEYKGGQTITDVNQFKTNITGTYTGGGTVQAAGGKTTPAGYVYGADVLDKKANNSAVNHLYKQYFGRDATQAELNNWGEKGGAGTSVRALEDFLKTEQVKYGVQQGTVPFGGISSTTGGGTGGTNAGGGSDITKTVDANVAFKQTDAYKNLPKEMQEFVDIAYNLIEVGGEEEARMFANAVSQAKAISDPYYKTQLALAGAEVLGAIAEANGDYETKAEIIKRTRDELLEDINTNKEYLSLEQQAEIARQASDYDADLLTIADQAAEKGLTFATGYKSRTEAERRRTEGYTDVIQSSNRKYNLQKQELELKASRGDLDAQKQLDALDQSKGFALQKIGRSAEEILGSANIPTIAGYTPTGGVAGKIAEEKEKTTLSDIAGFVDLQKGII